VSGEVEGQSYPPATAERVAPGQWVGGGVSPALSHLDALTFRQGLEETSKEALKALRCCVVRMVRGRLGLRGSFPSSPLPLLWLPCPLAGFMSPSSSSLFTVEDTIQPVREGQRQSQVLALYLQNKVYSFPWPPGPVAPGPASPLPPSPPSPPHSSPPYPGPQASPALMSTQAHMDMK
jgi:hypothetical protein